MDGPLHVERLVLVYQNLGNWSSYYYPLTYDHKYLAPIFGFLAYNGSNLSANHLPLLKFNATGKPIAIRFRSIKPLANGRIMMCIWFDADGSKPKFYDMASGNTCLFSTPGHCSIVDAPIVHHRKSVGLEIEQLVILAFVIGVILVCVIMRTQIWQIHARENREGMRRADAHDLLGNVCHINK